MAKVYEAIDGRLRELILAQPVFFVATAPSGPGGHVNLSPKGVAGSFAVLGPRRVAYLDYTGSGAETIAHLRDNGRIVLMFCAFEGPPTIVRLHGRGTAVRPQDAGFAGLRAAFPASAATDHGLRSVIAVDVERVSDSCGYAVPLMSYTGDRTLLAQWSGRRTDAQLVEYRASHNAVSIDGLPALSDPGLPDTLVG
ncbi:MAG TPA: pyridoxamine 5'-phosphate oxidase family protein [Micromonosporaceae bacterium]|nr:pyridoxamine 5'-phosphate oxidase family protein [Micromonosporaceae bacterium]